MKCSPRGKKNRKRSAVNVSFLSIVHSKLNPAFCGTFDNAKNSYVCQLSCSYLIFTSVNGGTGSSAITLADNIIKTAAKIIFATVFIFIFIWTFNLRSATLTFDFYLLTLDLRSATLTFDFCPLTLDFGLALCPLRLDKAYRIEASDFNFSLCPLHF